MSKETEDIVSVMRKAKEEIESLRQQLAAALDDLEVAKNVANGNVEAKFDAWKQLDAMEHELAAALAAIKVKDELIRMCAGSQVGYLKEALTIQPDDSALKAWLGEPVACRNDWRCQYAIDHGAEDLGHCPNGKCCMPLYAPKGMTK